VKDHYQAIVISGLMDALCINDKGRFSRLERL